MARVFLDANIIIDILENRKEIPLGEVGNHDVFISPLSVHIFLYIERKHIPHTLLQAFLENVSIVDFTDSIVQDALVGPTRDFEDNVQLHSAAEAECDIFLTSDKDLLKLKFFGKTKVISPQEMK